MSALCYLSRKQIKNFIKELAHNPGKLVLYIILIAGISVSVFSRFFSPEDEALNFVAGKRFVKGVLPFSNELRHKQYHIFIMLFDHNQSGTDCGLYFGNDIFPLNKGINRRCVFRQYLP